MLLWDFGASHYLVSTVWSARSVLLYCHALVFVRRMRGPYCMHVAVDDGVVVRAVAQATCIPAVLLVMLVCMYMCCRGAANPNWYYRLGGSQLLLAEACAAIITCDLYCCCPVAVVRYGWWWCVVLVSSVSVYLRDVAVRTADRLTDDRSVDRRTCRRVVEQLNNPAYRHTDSLTDRYTERERGRERCIE